jgi:hypothetical protein
MTNTTRQCWAAVLASCRSSSDNRDGGRYGFTLDRRLCGGRVGCGVRRGLAQSAVGYRQRQLVGQTMTTERANQNYPRGSYSHDRPRGRMFARSGDSRGRRADAAPTRPALEMNGLPYTKASLRGCCAEVCHFTAGAETTKECPANRICPVGCRSSFELHG